MSRAYDPRSRYRKPNRSAVTIAEPTRLPSRTIITPSAKCAVCGHADATGIDTFFGIPVCDRDNSGVR